jgi:hypothetical protein
MPDLSLQDALMMLDKWQKEQRIIQALFVDAESRKEFSCTVVGLIQELSESEVHIHSGEQLPRRDFPGCSLSLREARFSLLDSRNTPQGEPELQERIERFYEHVLVVRLPSGAECELYVFKEGTEPGDIFVVH